MKIKVKITAFAKNQLEIIDEYYKEAGYYRRGKRLRKELVKQSGLLSKDPKSGQEESYLQVINQGHRYLLIEPCYKIIYLQVEDVIYVTDIFDTRQNPNKINPKK